jgi:hypothetical protein
MPTAVEYALSNHWEVHHDTVASIDQQTTPTLSDDWFFAAPLVVLLLVIAAVIAVRAALPARAGQQAGCG